MDSSTNKKSYWQAVSLRRSSPPHHNQIILKVLAFLQPAMFAHWSQLDSRDFDLG